MSTALNNLINQDSEFSESKFKSKVENEFIQIMLSMVTGKTEKIKHFVSNEVYSNIVNKINTDIQNNRIQMYDELNVSNVKLNEIQEQEESFKIKVTVSSKALDYYINRSTRKFLSGNNKRRTDKITNIVFEKTKSFKTLGQARKCPYCAANLDINNTGKCNFCGSIFPLQNYDWVITYMDI